MTFRLSVLTAIALGLLLNLGVARADFVPVAVSGYTQDMVVEVIPSATPATASMDGGTGLSGYTWYQIGFNASAPTTGLPDPGTTFVSAAGPDHSFTLAPSYTDSNNAILIDGANSGTFVFATPANYPSLSFLTSTGSGNNVVSFTVHYADSTTFSGTFASPDWFGNTPVALTTGGRVAPTDFANNQVTGSGDPNLYQEDVTLGGNTSFITSIDFSLSSGGGHTAIFAVAGAVPEPSSYAMVGLACAGAYLLVRHRQKVAAGSL